MTVIADRPDQAAPTLAVERDPRNPRVRLEDLFDGGSCTPITAEDDSGMLAAIGRVDGSPTHEQTGAWDARFHQLRVKPGRSWASSRAWTASAARSERRIQLMARVSSVR